MAKQKSSALLPPPQIERRIYLIRGMSVMLSGDLAELYGVPVRQLHQAIKRNRERFPEDFLFPLTRQEAANLKSQIVTSSWGGARRGVIYAFTEEGVAMLSAVLRSQTAVAVSIHIMRAFVRLRQLLAGNEQLRRKLTAIEKRLADHDDHFASVFAAIRALMDADEKQSHKPRIGFDTEGNR